METIEDATMCRLYVAPCNKNPNELTPVSVSATAGSTEVLVGSTTLRKFMLAWLWVLVQK